MPLLLATLTFFHLLDFVASFRVHRVLHDEQNEEYEQAIDDDPMPVGHFVMHLDSLRLLVKFYTMSCDAL